MKNLETIETPKELKSIEVISSKCSDKYVPIYTTAILDALKGAFEFDYAVKPQKGSTMHVAFLTGEKADIKIYNSYDRRWALKIALSSNEADALPIDLGIDRLIHRGQKAVEFIEDLQDAKETILEALEQAGTVKKTLENTRINEDLAEVIKETIFKKITDKEGFQSMTVHSDLFIEKKVSVSSYIKSVIKEFYNGTYTVTNKGIKKVGRPVKSNFVKLDLETQIMKMIETLYFEYLL